MKRIIYSISFILLAFLFVMLALKGYDYEWTGFSAYTTPKGELIRQKTLWDWFDLLIVPIVLAIGAYLLDGSRKRSEREIESDRQKQQVLDEYFAYISELILDKGLADENRKNLVQELARTRTLTVLRILDGKRKSQLLQFLYEAKLINENPVIQLNGADFSNTELDEANLSGAELRGVYFVGSSIRKAYLIGADLRGSDFSRVDFSGADLSNARLKQSILDYANLKTSSIIDADLSDIDLAKVKLTNVQRIHLVEQCKRSDINDR